MPIDETVIENLKTVAHRLRLDLIEMFHSSGKGHLGGSLSIVEIMTALYFHVLRVDPADPKWPDRDRVVLSKGHSSAAWYAALAERGFFDRKILFTDYIRLGGLLQEHCDMKKVPGVEMSSGALGQGLSVGLGLSLAARLSGRDYRVYVIMGDGEMQEGQVWEALMACAHYRAGNLTAIIDYNNLQVSDKVSTVMDIGPLREKLEAFRWRTLEADGNDLARLLPVLEEAGRGPGDRPTAVIARTVKGRGVSFMENSVHWHSAAFGEEDYRRAMEELIKAGAASGPAGVKA